MVCIRTPSQHTRQKRGVIPEMVLNETSAVPQLPLTVEAPIGQVSGCRWPWIAVDVKFFMHDTGPFIYNFRKRGHTQCQHSMLTRTTLRK